MTEATIQRKTRRALGPRTFRSVLVPVDLSPNSDRTLGRVALLPLTDDVRVTLLHVVPSSLSRIEQQRAERDAHKALAVEVRHLRKQLQRKISVEPLVTFGAVAKDIASVATEVEAELIVMGRGNGRALRDTFLGSTAERVIRQARLPVLVVRLPPRGAYRRPALALDLDKAAHEVVSFMLRALPPPRPPVTIVHAFDDPYRGLIYPSLSEREAETRKDELRAKALQELSKLLVAALAKAHVAPEDEPLWITQVRYGSPRLIVEKAVEKCEADLLVLGTRGHSGAAYAFLGTVAGDLLRAVKCDVLVVPPARARA